MCFYVMNSYVINHIRTWWRRIAELMVVCPSLTYDKVYCSFVENFYKYLPFAVITIYVYLHHIRWVFVVVISMHILHMLYVWGARCDIYRATAEYNIVTAISMNRAHYKFNRNYIIWTIKTSQDVFGKR